MKDKYVSFRLNNKELERWEKIIAGIPPKGVSHWIKRKLGVLK